MKKNIMILVLVFVFQLSYGKHIDESTAKNIGQTFFKGVTKSNALKSSINLQMIYKANSKNNILPKSEPTTFFYVFNINATGFVIIAGDDNVTPILGYSDQGSFDPDNIPQNVAKWLEGYKKEIRYIIDKDIQADNGISEKWQALKNGVYSNSSAKTTGVTSVNPLAQTHWNQSPYYNALCPGGSVTGCVATAMAQIMKYWNYPASGSGFHSYNSNSYGTLSANFGGTTYEWGAMPNTVSSSNNAVATLMYQVGVSVDMNYSPQSSGAYVISAKSPITNCAEYALKNYFGYKNTLQGIQRINYTDIQWINLLESELNASRPILYAGFGSGGGHCFVADGYDNNNYIHFNWGWGGAYDGYFAINALNPTGTGTGGGSGAYNDGQQAVIGIQPPSVTLNPSLYLYNYVTPSSYYLYYGEPFTVTTNIVNYGTGGFTGDYTAAIFDDSYNFVDYIETLSGYNLQAGGYHYTNNLQFSTTGLYSMLPGNYYIGIFSRQTSGNWVQLADNNNYTNLVPITVTNSNNIELYSDISVTPGTTLTQGQPVSVNLNVINNGSSTFIGQYKVDLYNLDGTWAQSIGTENDNTGLPPGYIYSSPYLIFNSSAVTVVPGTYLLAVQHNPSGNGWELTGSSNHQNPIKVTVIAPPLQPDIYEVNNSVVQSYNLPISFTGNNATKNTSGSNCHITTDNDYYKINLPAGNNFSITSRLHDSYNSGNGNIYSLDALFSYSTDGVNWSDTYDDIMPNNIIMSGGHTIYFHVAPYFAGDIGTYLLDLQLTKTPYQFIWTGITSTDWTNGSNWSTGTVPTVTDDITIPSSTPFSPIIKGGIIGHCKSINVKSGAIVTLSTGSNLKVGL